MLARAWLGWQRSASPKPQRRSCATRCAAPRAAAAAQPRLRATQLLSHLARAFSPLQVKNISHDGNLSLDDVIAIARIMRPRSMARELKGTVREILGTCQSVGCTIDGDSATDMLQKASCPGFRRSVAARQLGPAPRDVPRAAPSRYAPSRTRASPGRSVSRARRKCQACCCTQSLLTRLPLPCLRVSRLLTARWRFLRSRSACAPAPGHARAACGPRRCS